MSNPLRTGEVSPPTPEKRTEEELERTVLWKVTIRLIPFLCVLYVAAYLDRINVSFAKLQMTDELGLSDTSYGLGVGIFFIGYYIFEIPSNLILERTGARRWIARIMISWGIISAAMMFINSAFTFYVLRFLLGLAEAGFFPGIILYLTYWFPAVARARAVAWFMTATALTGVFGAPLSTGILDSLDGMGGLGGWRWLFLVEGIPSVLLGVVILFYLTDRPELAGWLTADERSWLTERLKREQEHRERHHRFSLFQALSNGRVWLLTVTYFSLAMTSYGFTSWLPQMIKDSFQMTSNFRVGVLAAIAYFSGAVGMVINGHHSDWTRERRWHVAVPAFVGAVGLALGATFLESPVLLLLGMSMTALGFWSMLGPFWALPTSFLSGTAAAGGIALINSVGNLGGFVGPWEVGLLKDLTKSYVPGLLVLAAGLVIGAIVVLCFPHDPALEHVDKHQD